METKFTFAKTLIREAGSFIRSEMTENLKIEEKTRFDDLVTNLDKNAQELLIAKIKTAYPEDNVMAEENGVRHPITDGHVWILDPIDGTVNFIVQRENFAVMIAYYEDGVGRFGLIYDVMNDVLYAGGGRFDVYANDKKLFSYRDKPFNRCLIGANSSMYAENIHGIRDLSRQTLGVRVYGGAGISMSHVMSGRLLAYFSYIQPWDYAAAFIMGEKLGYRLLTLDGQKPDFKSRQMVMFVPEQKLKAIQQFIK
ncbi:inositol monophosphatase family protein [Streptococcus chenjunshii]|uniref:Inositol monophosphatase family protein n=1 Tax=Streptococcus chenjunshii TaxID=2173853 RepID=A0A372KNY7_9STRE|nr:inositol monophosphatase family protein [Streptococcus chenjunshii]AXQ78736.1 inositol monophosphatase family protein [Streptococcus chenjunshii]RFU51671.1 inositol monophosphatase family protein [Streptococcus chenjunshii]RFU53992.1 inositol monophosphatase family protein [Streptococcus chenjunshii]